MENASWLNIAQISREAKIGTVDMHRFMNGQKNLGTKTLLQLSEVLKEKANAFRRFTRAITPTEPEPVQKKKKGWF